MNDRLRSWFAIPARDAGPVERLRWVRRMEITSGVLAIVLAIRTWSTDWWTWLLLGSAAVMLSPWLGPAAILRRAEKHPEVLEHDPAAGRRRARRALKIMVPAFVAILTAVGYLTLGWGGAVFFFVMAVVGSVGGVWLYRQTEAR